MSVSAYHFWSPTCGPCKVIKPALEDLKEEFLTVDWTTVNTHDDAENLARLYGVKVVPTIVVIARDENGQVLLTEKQSGTNISAYYRILRNAQKAITQT
jgi:thiol-disulfide isomerase/thioredoxin